MNKKKDKCKKEVRDVSQFVVKILIIKKENVRKFTNIKLFKIFMKNMGDTLTKQQKLKNKISSCTITVLY